MAYPINYNGQLNANEVFASVFNMIISQQVFADNVKDTKASLVDAARVDGSMYGDTKLYYSTDVLQSYVWGGDAEATKLLELNRPADPQVQAVTLNIFRQIRLTVDNYLTKRAWTSEGAFDSFNSIMLGWIRDTKRVYDSTTYNAYVGSFETNEGKQEVIISLPTDASSQEAENRLQAQTIASKLADILVDLEDVSRDYNDYENLRSYSADDFRFVWNSSYVNKIRKLDLPTIFHKDFIDKFAEYTLPARYFGKVGVVTGDEQKSDGVAIRSLIEQDVVLAEEHNYKGQSLPAGTHFHVFAGDIIPAGIVVASANEIIYPFYTEDSTIVLKIVHKTDIPYMSAFEAGTSFFNARSLTENRYLTWGHNTLVHLHDKPFITIRATEAAAAGAKKKA